MRQALMHRFPEEETASCYRIGKVEEDLASAIGEGKTLIVGHIDFSHLQQVEVPKDYQLLAMFRDPVDRIISTYLHFQKHKDPRYSTWKGGEVNFEEFMKSEFANNWICQLLSGTKGLTAPLSQDEKIYKEAIRNLDRLNWIGISESFEDSLFSLSQHLGKTLKNPGRFNEGTDGNRHQELRQEHAVKLNAHNGLDLQLYKLAQNRLDDQVSSIKYEGLKRLWFNLRSGK